MTERSRPSCSHISRVRLLAFWWFRNASHLRPVRNGPGRVAWSTHAAPQRSRRPYQRGRFSQLEGRGVLSLDNRKLSVTGTRGPQSMVPCYQAMHVVSDPRAVTQDFHQVTGRGSIALWT